MEHLINGLGKLSVGESLNRTSKGQLHYDRNPLTPFTSDSRHHGLSTQIAPKQPSPTRFFGLDHNRSLGLQNGLDKSPKVNRSLPDEVKIRKSVNNVKSPVIGVMKEVEYLNSPNASFEVMKNIIELVENSTSPNVRITSISDDDTQTKEQMLLLKRKVLESRLVPPTECSMEMDRMLQKRQEEAKLCRQQENDQLERKLRTIQTLQEKQKLDEENKRKIIEQQRIEAHSRASTCVDKFNQVWKGIVEVISSCRDREYLNPQVQPKVFRMKDLKSNFDGVIKRMHEMENPVTVAIQGEEFTTELEAISQAICKLVQEANNRAAEKDSLKTVPAATPATPVNVQQAAAPVPAPVDVAQAQSKEESVRDELDNIDFVHPNRFTFYTDLMNELYSHQATHANIVNSKEQHMKQFKFDCQKAVNTPVNAISPLSANHLRDKLDKLRNLLSGSVVEVGGRRFSATQQPGGLEYVADLLARKFVRQGEDVVSSNPDSAFAIAAVIVALWREFPKFGRLFLAHYFQMCPYLVPYYVPQQEGQSDQDYYKALGYQYIDGQIEKQDKFLKRMSGLVGLYAAVIIAVPRQQQPHPYGLSNGWSFLAAVLNLPPRAEITATVLFHFLEVVGSAMKQTYGKQFFKMLHLLCTEYFNLIKKVTPEGCGGPLVRLEDLLQKAVKSGGIPPPNGQLSANFW